MPSTLAGRVNGTPTIVVKSPEDTETFNIGLKSFVNEARLLAQFDHPALVKVYRFWEANGTAYMAMPAYEGPTLRHALAEREQRPDEAWLRQLLNPLLDALIVLHSAQCFHRDIAPDNILLTPKGPVLLDFGAARRVIGNASRLTVILKEGYAPLEQYGWPSLQQGAWTDIYALCCVIRFAITGTVPMPAIERLQADRMEPLCVLCAGRYARPFLETVDAGMALMPENRPQSVAQFRAALDGDTSPATRLRKPAIRDADRETTSETQSRAPAPSPVLDERREASPQPKAPALRMSAWLAGAAALALAVGTGWWVSAGRTTGPQPQLSGAARGPETSAAIAPAAPAAASARTAGPALTPTASTTPVSDRVQQPTVIETADATPVSSAASPPVASESPSTQEATKVEVRKNLPRQRASSANTVRSAPSSRGTSRPETAADKTPAPPRPTRCSELQDKASLEPLSSEETDFLRTQCR
jgi:serine/threonine protein kinase